MADQDTPSRRRRRDHSPELKRELVRQYLLPGASVSSIAMAHGINADLVFKWRREHLAVEASGSGPVQASAPQLLPITLASATPSDACRHLPCPHRARPAPPPAA
ncbi:transposase [Pelomonas sp. Root1217]|uniref:transposase n=1 Tax=Pelomonas sp. Root1217 TaxID=1736430 RepID=UPI0009E69223|nr:transposase [Pelomonas sp. Root1217]